MQWLLKYLISVTSESERVGGEVIENRVREEEKEREEKTSEYFTAVLRVGH